MDSNGPTRWESCFLQALLAKLGFQDLRGKAEHLKQQEHTGAEIIVEPCGTEHPWASRGLFLQRCYVPEVLFVFPSIPTFLGLYISKLLASLYGNNKLSEEAGECITKKNIPNTLTFFMAGHL